MTKLEEFNKQQLKKVPELRPGYTIRVYQKVKEGDKQRIQVFEGLIIAAKHGRGINGTITVRRSQNGYGVERVFPVHAPFIEKIEVVKKSRVRRAKLYYIRKKSAKESRLTEIRETAKKEEAKEEPKKEESETKTEEK